MTSHRQIFGCIKTEHSNNKQSELIHIICKRHSAPLPLWKKSQWIRPAEGNMAKRLFSLNTFSKVERAYLRYVSSGSTNCTINGKETKATSMGGYSMLM